MGKSITINPQNYMGVNFHESAQYSESESKVIYGLVTQEQEYYAVN